VTPALPDDGTAAPVVPTTVEGMIRHRLATALGGWRGALETALPTVVFVGLWVLTEDLRLSIISALVVAVVLGAVRLVQRSSLQHVVGAAIATGIAAFFALRSGRAEDAFLPGILTSLGFGVATLVSVLVRWPVVGFLVGAGDPRAQEDPVAWRRDPAVVRVCQRLTWVMVAMYAVRVAVMGPLYFAGNVAALGVAKLVLGWPLWVAALAIMGAMLVRGNTPLEEAAPAE
jgi:uncharacterized membrane protein YqjE